MDPDTSDNAANTGPSRADTGTRSLKEMLRSRIHTSEALLATMTTPTQSPAQIILHVGYIERMSELARKVADDLLDIDPTCRDHINGTELKEFSTSMINIGRKASAIYGNLCTWEASITRACLALNQAMRSIQHGMDHRKEGAVELAKADHTCITMDYDYLKQEVTQYGSYLTSEDHVITKGMEMREEWRNQKENITRDLYNLITRKVSPSLPHTLPPSHHLGLHPRAGHLEHERRGDGHKHIYSLHAIHDRSPASITATKRWDTPPGTTGCAFRCAGTWNTNNTSTHL